MTDYTHFGQPWQTCITIVVQATVSIVFFRFKMSDTIL